MSRLLQTTRSGSTQNFTTMGVSYAALEAPQPAGAATRMGVSYAALEVPQAPPVGTPTRVSVTYAALETS